MARSFTGLEAATLGIVQTVAYDTSTTATNTFGPMTYQVRLVANSAAHFHVFNVGDTTTATTSDPFLPASWIEYIRVTPGQKISFVKAGTNGLVTATTGTAWVTEVTG